MVDTEVESFVREITGQPPTRRSLHFLGKESSKSKTDEVRSSLLAAERVTNKARIVFNRLGTQRSLTLKSERTQPT